MLRSDQVQLRSVLTGQELVAWLLINLAFWFAEFIWLQRQPKAIFVCSQTKNENEDYSLQLKTKSLVFMHTHKSGPTKSHLCGQQKW